MVGAICVAIFCTAPAASGATLHWTGGGGVFWNDPGDWDLGRGPLDGDDIIFQGFINTDVVDNYATLTLGSLGFAPATGQFNVHIQGDLFLNGAGIVNNTSFQISGVIRQEIFADGATGGRIIFQNNATVGGSAPVNITAQAGAVGGTIIFEGNSTAANGFFTGLIAEGATTAGGGAGTIIFRGNSHTVGQTSAVARGGTVSGAQGGQITFQDNAIMDGQIDILPGAGGQGGRIYFRGNSANQGSITSFGGGSLEPGAEGVIQFFDTSHLNGLVANYDAGVVGALGSRLELHDHADASGALIFNFGSPNSGVDGGHTQFFDFATAGNATIFNRIEAETNDPGGTRGGMTEFFGNSSAGTAHISNDGQIEGGGSLPGRTYFRGNSTAANATLTATSGRNGGDGGQIFFEGSASGGNAQAIIEAGAILDISALTTAGTTIGSVEGDGTVYLGSKTLTLGGNDLNTSLGAIADGGQAGGTGGSIVKVGLGIMTLTGTSTYTGSTTVSAGALFVEGTIGGSGVSVANGASFGGSGFVNAPVTMSAGPRSSRETPRPARSRPAASRSIRFPRCAFAWAPPVSWAARATISSTSSAT